ncbi:MAG: branched-chain amino acid ABC transporter substrate-binding protein, partial [Chloroflexi bacterium]|nr:branched-chain amino acid ABC transporter substrate-binding protein [Chloroflexota bacterium]
RDLGQPPQAQVERPQRGVAQLVLQQQVDPPARLGQPSEVVQLPSNWAARRQVDHLHRIPQSAQFRHQGAVIEVPPGALVQAAVDDQAEDDMAEDDMAEDDMADDDMADDMGAMPEECAEENACAVFAPGDTIKIGYAGPTAGDFSAFGTDISDAGLLAVAQAEDLEGFSFELLVEDTGGSGEGGAAVANLFASNPQVVAIAGHTFSGSTEAAIPIYNEARLPMLSPSATNPALTGGDQDVFNRIPFTDSIQGRFIAEYLYNTLEIRAMVALHDGDTYGEGLATIVQDEFVALGGEVLDFSAITPGETDYTAPLTAVQALGPEAIFYGGYDAEGAALINGLGIVGLNEVVFIGADGIFGATLLEQAGDNAEGVIATAALPPESEAVDEFNAAFEAEYGRAAGSLSTFTWHGYDVVSALISAIRDVAVLGDDGNLYIPREALIDAVRGLSGFEGLTGTISCNEDGECNTAGPTFFSVQDGAWATTE